MYLLDQMYTCVLAYGIKIYTTKILETFLCHDPTHMLHKTFFFFSKVLQSCEHMRYISKIIANTLFLSQSTTHRIGPLKGMHHQLDTGQFKQIYGSHTTCSRLKNSTTAHYLKATTSKADFPFALKYQPL